MQACCRLSKCVRRGPSPHPPHARLKPPRYDNLPNPPHHSTRPTDPLGPICPTASSAPVRPSSARSPLHHPRRRRRDRARHGAAARIEDRKPRRSAARQGAWIETAAASCRARAREARARAGNHRQRRAGAGDRPARPALTRAKRELPPRLLELAAQHGLTVVADQHPRSALALGILLAHRPHLPELAAGGDAGRRSATTC